MLVNLAKTLLKNAGIKPEPVENNLDPLFNWYGVKLTVNEDKEILVYINELTRFLVATPYESEMNLEASFSNALQKTLKCLRFDEKTIRKYLDQAGKITFWSGGERKYSTYAISQGKHIKNNLTEFLEIFNINDYDFPVASMMVSYIPQRKGYYFNTAFIPAQEMIDIITKRFVNSNYSIASFNRPGVLLEIKIPHSPYPFKRTLLTPADISFSALADFIQSVVGWDGAHLDEFKIYLKNSKKPLLTLERLETSFFGFEPVPEFSELNDKLTMDNFLVKDFLDTNYYYTYTYDFGDDWKHKILIKGVFPHMGEVPVLVESEGAEPIEDVGGIGGWRYATSLVEDRDAGSELDGEDLDFLEWLGDWSPYYPEYLLPSFV